MLKVMSTDLWNAISLKDKNASTRRAAISYLGDSPPITFGDGDLLVVDASDASIKCGRTSVRSLLKFHRAGSQLFSYPNLHCKAMLLDDWAIIGSANNSQLSSGTYFEAAVVTDRPDLAGQIEKMIAYLVKRSARIDASFLKRIAALPVTRTSPLVSGSRKKQRSTALRLEPRTWFVSLWEGANYPGDAEKVNDVTREEQQKVGRKAGKVDWIFWSGNSRFVKEAREGDIIVECLRPQAKIRTTRSVRVFRHASIKRVFKERGVKATTFHCLWPPDSERTALHWSKFTELAARAGVRPKLSYNSTRELTEQSTALFELWPR